MLPFLIFVVLLFIFLLVQSKLPFKFICNLGLHVMPDANELPCEETEYQCPRCGKKLQL